MNRPREVEVVIWFGENGEPPDQDEIEAAIQARYPEATILEYDEEEV